MLTGVDAKNERLLELAATALLALATVGTAWSAYQAREWTGEQAQGTSHATSARIEVNRAAALANRQVQIDVATFIEWVNARAQGRSALASFYRARFRKEFEPAFVAWLATKPLTNKAAPKTPFELGRYRLAADRQAQRLELQAAADSAHAKDANERADNYMLAVVLFASALFFAGISSKLQQPNVRAAVLALGGLVLLASAIWIATFPVRLTT